RDPLVTGVQTCALPISSWRAWSSCRRCRPWSVSSAPWRAAPRRRLRAARPRRGPLSPTATGEGCVDGSSETSRVQAPVRQRPDALAKGKRKSRGLTPDGSEAIVKNIDNIARRLEGGLGEQIPTYDETRATFY